MKMIGWLAVALLALVSMSAGKTKVELKDGQGKDVGSVVIWDQGAGVALEVNVHDLTPGEHGIHFHQMPKCEGPDFKSAGGHFNPESKKHGFDNPDGHHRGCEWKGQDAPGRCGCHVERWPAFAADEWSGDCDPCQSGRL